MNKPDKCKIIMELDDLYCKNLLKVFNSGYNERHTNLHGRPHHFKKVECNFIINRYVIEDEIKFTFFKKNSKSLLLKLKEMYGPGEIWNMQISKMQGGGSIIPHVDLGIGFVFSHRIHIPLITNKKVIFKIDNENFYFSSGKMYEINNLKVHSVANYNNANYYRIHLIFDYISAEYIPFLKDILGEIHLKNIKTYTSCEQISKIENLKSINRNFNYF